MKISITITPTEEFGILCDLFKVQPEELLQKFVERTSFPFYYSQPDGDERWATLFFLSYIGQENHAIDEELPLHEPFMNALADVVFKHLDASHTGAAKAEVAARKVMKQWHKHIMVKRGK